jgi:uncharacterized phage-associated protein
MILCKASEVGKIVVNKCLARGIFINTRKLERLLILMQLECLERSKKPLFTEDIVIWKSGIAIPKVDADFLCNAIGFTEEQTPYILLLEKEEEAVEYVLKEYAYMDSFELDLLYAIKNLEILAIEMNGERVVPLIALQGKYL